MRILVLGDDQAVVRTVGRMLAYHEVSRETEPDVALARLRAGEKFDLVLCDMTLPGTCGADVLDSVRAWYGAACPMLVLVSNADDVAAGSADAILRKPVRTSELNRLVAVSRTLRAQRPQAVARTLAMRRATMAVTPKVKT